MTVTVSEHRRRASTSRFGDLARRPGATGGWIQTNANGIAMLSVPPGSLTFKVHSTNGSFDEHARLRRPRMHVREHHHEQRPWS